MSSPFMNIMILACASFLLIQVTLIILSIVLILRLSKVTELLEYTRQHKERIPLRSRFKLLQSNNE